MNSKQIHILSQGIDMTNPIKDCIIEIYLNSLQQQLFSSQSGYVKFHLEEKLGPHWIVFIWEKDQQIYFSRLSDQVMFEFIHEGKHILVLRTCKFREVFYQVNPLWSDQTWSYSIYNQK